MYCAHVMCSLAVKEEKLKGGQDCTPLWNPLCVPIAVFVGEGVARAKGPLSVLPLQQLLPL